jgi:hypothetical protein
MESNAQRVTAGKGVFPIQKIIGWVSPIDMFSRVLPATEASGATAISTRFSPQLQSFFLPSFNPYVPSALSRLYLTWPRPNSTRYSRWGLYPSPEQHYLWTSKSSRNGWPHVAFPLVFDVPAGIHCAGDLPTTGLGCKYAAQPCP